MFLHAKQTLIKIISSWIHSPFWGKVASLAMSFWMLFAGIHSYFYAVIAFTVIDVITGIAASLKKGEKFKSRILRKGLIEKLCLYMVLMVSVFILESVVRTGIKLENYWLVMVATVLISTYEFSSIVENILVINPKLVFLKQLKAISKSVAKKATSIDNSQAE